MNYQFELFENEHYPNGTIIAKLRLAGLPDSKDLESAKQEVLRELPEYIETPLEGYDEWTTKEDEDRETIHVLTDPDNKMELHIFEEKNY